MHFTTLLIEPPGIDSQLLQLMLAPEKFQVETAECGPDAWNLILKNEPPDLLIIDTDLPLNGTLRIGAGQLLQLMADQPAWRDTPKLMLTSDHRASVLQHAKEAGISAVILKPYDPRRFMQEVCNSLSRQLEAHIKAINSQHLELGRQLMALSQSCKHGKRQKAEARSRLFLQALDKHFAFEEAFMSRHQYPDALAHHRGHRDLMNNTENVFSDMFSNDSTLDAGRLEQLRRELFVGVDDDKRYIDFLHDLIDSLLHHD